MNKLRKALETIALGYSQGNCSVDTLIKACEFYKNKNGIVDSYDYEILIAKSCIDAINGVEQDPEIIKAIVPGQTKVVDGILYIYSATKVGSKTQYDWHVVRKGTKTQAEIGRGAKLSDTSIKGKQKYVNDLFPNDLSKLTVVKNLGGSTGAKLVQDANGNSYVLKKGSNTSSDHVKGEYLANQLYGILGLRTPDYELYDDNGEAVLLSRFISGTHIPRSTDFGKMAEGFMSDVLLANWDVYQNDNCLVSNANGTVYRVDNGGCLNYRAQGAQKTFDGNVFDTWKSMHKYNPGISNLLTEDDQLAQIDALMEKKDDIVNYLKEIGEDSLAKVMSDRFDGLKQISSELQKTKAIKAQKAAAKLGQILPRNLKPEDEMYAEIDEKRIEEIMGDTAKQVGCKVDDERLLTARDKQGWALLANICKERGFDARPEVVDEKKFWELRKKTEHPLMMRGFDRQSYLEDFKFSDFCHFGSYGIWGQGIYAHSDDVSIRRSSDQHAAAPIDNKSDETNWKQSDIYINSSESAVGYANGNEDNVAKMFWAPGANVINSEDLLDEIKKMGAKPITAKAKKLKKEMDEIKAEWTKAELALMNIEDTVKKSVFKQIGYDEQAVGEMTDFFQNVNWNSRNAQGKRNYPMFDEAVIEKIKPCVEKCGGTAEILNAGESDEQIKIEKGSETLYISKYSWNHNAVKQKNQFTAPYHFQAERFMTFFNTNFVKPAYDAVEKEMKTGKTVRELQDSVSKLKTAYYKTETDYNKEMSSAPATGGKSNDIYSRIYNTVKNCNYSTSGNDHKSLIGIYAALKGYDGIYQPDGNDSGHGFTIILNRSKIITSVQ